MLTAGICHEIMNPLSGIKGPLFVIERSMQENSPGGDNTAVMEGIGHVKKNVNRIADIVGTMRSLFHGEEYTVEEVELASLVSPLIEVLRDRVGERVTIESGVAQGLVVRTNRSALTQIMMNVLANAVDSISGSGKVRIEAISDPHRIVTVKDTGSGIPGENLRKIFDLAFLLIKHYGNRTTKERMIVRGSSPLCSRIGIGLHTGVREGDRGTVISYQVYSL